MLCHLRFHVSWTSDWNLFVKNSCLYDKTLCLTFIYDTKLPQLKYMIIVHIHTIVWHDDTWPRDSEYMTESQWVWKQLFYHGVALICSMSYQCKNKVLHRLMDSPQKLSTAQTYGLATKTMYCTDLWTLHRLMGTAHTYWHCTDVWTLYTLMDTA